MKQRILCFEGLNHPDFDVKECVPSGDTRFLKMDFTTISPGTELFCIRGGETCRPGYIMTGHDETGRHYFVFPSMSESHSAHCNCRAFGPETLLVELPEGFPLELAGFLRFANIGLLPLLRFGALPAHVAVIGLGPVGNLAAQSARILGCRVTGVDCSPRRRELAGECGVEETITPEEFSRRKQTFDRVIDTVSSSGTLSAAAAALCDGGICHMVGIVREGELAASTLCREIWNRDLRFLSGWEMKHPFAAIRSNLERAVRWTMQGRYRLSPLLTGVIAPELPAIGTAYRNLADDPEHHFCYVIDWRGAEG